MADQSPVPVKRPVGRPRKVPLDAAAPPKPKPKPKAKAKKKQTTIWESMGPLAQYLPHLAPFGGLLISALSMAVASVMKKRLEEKNVEQQPTQQPQQQPVMSLSQLVR